jgi:hypothetical protein
LFAKNSLQQTWVLVAGTDKRGRPTRQAGQQGWQANNAGRGLTRQVGPDVLAFTANTFSVNTYSINSYNKTGGPTINEMSMGAGLKQST